MEEVTCPLCEKRISTISMALGLAIFIDNQLVHLACTQDHSITEINQKIQEWRQKRCNR